MGLPDRQAVGGPRIGLIVGNGLPIDLRVNVWGDDVRPWWHPSHPLRFPLETEGTPYIDQYPRFAATVRAIQENNPASDDFEVFREIVEGDWLDWPENTGLLGEAERFLMAGYSAFQAQVVDGYIRAHGIEGWSWLSWLHDHGDRLAVAVSFNYDLILERLLEAAGLEYTGVGLVGEPQHGVPLFKPHGSVDHMPALVPVGPGITYVGCNIPQQRMPITQVFENRNETNIVLPGEISRIRGLQSVEAGWELFRNLGPTLTHCVIFGLSYSDRDRPEIDFFLDQLRPGIRVAVADPSPSTDLMQALRVRGLDATSWPERPESFASLA